MPRRRPECPGPSRFPSDLARVIRDLRYSDRAPRLILEASVMQRFQPKRPS